MKEKEECPVIQDLLPNYIEKLTAKETNRYIEKHIEGCDVCKHALENMTKDEGQITHFFYDQEKEINFMKKINKKIMQLKTVILIILGIFVIIVTGKAAIMLDLLHKAQNISKNNNYHIELNIYQGLDSKLIESYKKENKSITTIFSLYNNTTDKITEFYDGEKTNTYIDSEGERFALLNTQGDFNKLVSTNNLYEDNVGRILLNAIFGTIESVTCNGKECYYITNIKTSMMIDGNSIHGIYIEKETGLPIRILQGEIHTNKKTINSVIDYKYEFNVTRDDDIKEPDIKEYRIER